MLEERFGVRPLVWPELPLLSSRHHAYHALPAHATQTAKVSRRVTREANSAGKQAYQASSTPPNFARASTLSTTKYRAFLASGPWALVRAWYTCRTSSVRPVDDPPICRAMSDSTKLKCTSHS